MRKYIIKYFYRRVPAHLDAEYDLILQIHSHYYRRLDPGLQRRFRLRLYQLLNTLSFAAPKGGIVSREARAVIGSAIIQITFGLSSYLPIKFTNIVVMPQRYMYPGYGEPFLGHIDYPSSTLYFSWADVKEGYRIPHDAVNVALHEMAHVLESEDRFRYLFDNFFRRISWGEWARLAFQKMHIIRAGENRFLKDYGGINMTEMFAVCIEAFFEQPDSFCENLPEIYGTMVDLLGQDPMREGNPMAPLPF